MVVNGKHNTLASFPQERNSINIKVETGQVPGPIRTCLDIRKSSPTGIWTSVRSNRSLVALQRKPLRTDSTKLLHYSCQLRVISRTPRLCNTDNDRLPK